MASALGLNDDARDSMAAKATITAAIDATLRDSPDLADTIDRLTLLASWSLTNGTGADQVDNLVHDERPIGAGFTEALNLQLITNPLGQTFGFGVVKVMYFEILTRDEADHHVVVGVDPAHPAGKMFDRWLEWDGMAAAGVKVRSGTGVARGGGQLIVAPDATGYAVDDTHKTLLITNPNAFVVTVRFVIIGVQPG
jgi:hypothetical protein